MHSECCRQIIERLYQFSESSMDRTSSGDFATRYQVLKSKYGARIQQKGQAAILLEIEDYIAAEINQYYQEKNLSFQSGITLCTLGRDPYHNNPGKAAKEQQRCRKEFTENELGVLHTVMRALDNVVGTGFGQIIYLPAGDTQQQPSDVRVDQQQNGLNQ